MQQDCVVVLLGGRQPVLLPPPTILAELRYYKRISVSLIGAIKKNLLS